MKRARVFGFVLAGVVAGAVVGQGVPIGFEETYALAADRAKAVTTLIPGTEEHYYYTCRERLDARDFAAVAKILGPWIQRHGRTHRVVEIENRAALLDFDADPGRAWTVLRNRLSLNFNHERVVPGAKSDLPTRLETITNEALTRRALDRHPETVNGFTDRALAGLAAMSLSKNQLHNLLSRLKRPDVENLPELVVRDLGHRESGGFGSQPIHSLLRRAQLEECVRLKPELLQEPKFVQAYLARLQPGGDTDWREDPAELRAQLARLWEFAQRLSPAFNSLKSHVLYHWLALDLTAGAPDKDRFLAYIRLPRPGRHAAPDHLKRHGREEMVDPSASPATGLPPVGDDEALVRACLEAFFATEDGYAPYAEFLRADWLKVVLAETKILAGQGDLERWYSMLNDPAALNRLEKRVDLEFARTSRTRFAANEPVKLEVLVKNVPTLIVKVFAIDSLRYHVEKQAPVDASIELDGVVPTSEQTVAYQDPPLRRVLRTFELPMLKDPGTYVVELVGNGMSSRAVLHKGDLRAVERTAAAGQCFRVFDEAGAHLKDASIWFGGREYLADDAGEILLPFSTDPSQRKAVLRHGNRSTLAAFDHRREEYRLHASVHVDRESLVAGKTARILVRPQLRLSGHAVSLALLQQPALRIVATDLDGLETMQMVRDVALADDRELVHEISVPERLTSIRVGLSGRVKDLAGKDVDLDSGAAAFTVNGIDATVATSGVVLAQTRDGFVLEVRGKDGEPKVGHTCQLRLHHRDYTDPIEVSLQTDADGRIGLGMLAGIQHVHVRQAHGYEGAFEMPRRHIRLPAAIHALAGEVVRVPWQGEGAAPSRANVTLLGIERDELDKVAIADGFLELRGLEPGDYDLALHDSGDAIRVRVTRGARSGDWLLGRDRSLEAPASRPLHVRSIAVEKDEIVVRVANASKSTRVHVVATRYTAPFDAFVDLAGAFEAHDRTFQFDRIPTTYHSGRKLGDEYRYVLERRFATKYPGNMLRRPSLLLNPWSVDDDSRNEATGLGGGKGSPLGGNRIGRRGGAGGGTGGAGGAVSRPGAHMNLDFLPQPSVLIANLSPDAEGLVRVKGSDLGDGQIVHVVAIDGDQTVYDSTLRDEKKLAPRARRLAASLDVSQHFVEQKRVEFVAPGGSAVLDDARSAKVELYDSLSGAYRLLATLCPDPSLAKFAFVLQWPKLPPEKKRELYSQHACHELHFFLYKKDPEFFAAVVKPHLANKLDKVLLDHWLLGDDLTRYLEVWSFSQLNLIEKILLAQRLAPPQQEAVARLIRESAELRPIPIEQIERLFRTALDSNELAREKGAALDDLRANAESAPGLKPAAAPPPPKEQGARDEQARKAAKEARLEANKAAEGKEEEAADEDKDRAQAPHKLADELEKRGRVVALFKAVDPTKVFAEQRYWRKTLAETTADLVAPNRFWVDYATAKPGTPFASPAVLQAGGSFLEAMFALAVLDLPFEAGRHEIVADGDRRTLRAATPLLLVRKEFVKTTKAADQPPMLLGENFFRLDDRYRFENGEQRDAFVTDEFLADVGYGCQVVVTNPTSSKRTVEVLLQIPAGALPLNRGFWTKGRPVEIAPYATTTIEYAFYFPGAGDFAHYPAHVSEKGRLAASADARTLHVVLTPSRIDTTSWEHVSQQGSPAEVIAHVDGANVQRLDLSRIAWRMKDREFFSTVLARLRSRHVYDDTLWSYAILHRDVDSAREYLRHANDFLKSCGAWMRSTLVSIDPKERRDFEHLELEPLVHPRAHRLGAQRVIGNADLAKQYARLLDILGYHETLDSADWVAVTYYLLLQDRVEEGLAAFAKVDPAQVPVRIQYDYLQAYVGFFTGDVQGARRTAERYREYPVDHWRKRFTDVIAQLDEIEGRVAPANGGGTTDHAAMAPSLELTLDGPRGRIAYRNIGQAEVRYFELDVEFAFSAQPFASEAGTSAAFVRPSLAETKDLPPGGSEVVFDIPAAFHSKNVLVEVRGKGLVRSRTYFANALDVRVIESWGQVAVSELQSHKPLAKTYVKVFAKLPDGQVRFHKDGYTDLRGRFDYASLSDDPNAGAARYSVLVLSDDRGAVIREVSPPAR
jgi:hypothetical protein